MSNTKQVFTTIFVVIIALWIFSKFFTSPDEPVAPATPESLYLQACVEEYPESFCRCSNDRLVNHGLDPADPGVISQLIDDDSDISTAMADAIAACAKYIQ